MWIFVMLLVSIACTGKTTLTASWSRGFDNLSDYQLMSSASAATVLECTALISRLSGAQLVTHNSSTGVCRAYKYRLSPSEVRKCRNISTSETVWVPSSNAATCWTTVQHRVSDSVNFVRNWTEYKAGFGEGPNGNFWIGLDTINSLTSASGGRKLRFLMKAWNGSEYWAQYSSFSVGPESDGFRLSVSGFSSSHPAIGDSFSATNGFKFTTIDRDYDSVNVNCAAYFNGAWWFDACSRMHANGLYQLYPTALNTPLGQGIIWVDGFGYYYSLVEIEMIIF